MNPDHIALPQRQNGFTLVELITVVTLASILMGMGVPAYRSLLERNWRAGLTNSVVGDLMLARSEAIKRNHYVSLCHSTNGRDCGGSWQDGWIVFEDRDGDGALDNDDTILSAHMPDVGPYRLDSIRDHITYYPTGMADAALDLVVKKGSSVESCVAVALTGRPRLKKGGCS